jgi:hypothetical protein
MLTLVLAFAAATLVPGWSGKWNVDFELGIGSCFLQDVQVQYPTDNPKEMDLYPAMVMFVEVASSNRDIYPLAADTNAHELLLLFRFPYAGDGIQTVTSIRVEGVEVSTRTRMEEQNGVWFRLREPKSREIFDKLKSHKPIAISAFFGEVRAHDLSIGVESLERFNVAAEMFTACGRAIGA